MVPARCLLFIVACVAFAGCRCLLFVFDEWRLLKTDIDCCFVISRWCGLLLFVVVWCLLSVGLCWFLGCCCL